MQSIAVMDGMGMGKISKIDLSGVPWPISLLECYRRADEMQSGDELVVSVEDEDIKDSLNTILKTLPEHSFQVSRIVDCYEISVVRGPRSVSDRECSSENSEKNFVSP